MAIHNVATVVGPNLLRSPDETPFLLVQHTPAVNEISCDILRNWKMMVDVRVFFSSSFIQKTQNKH